jgi:predicted component of viral defense system (DUF524 family)
MAIQVSGVNDWLLLNGAPVIFGPREENLGTEAHETSNNRFRVTECAPDDLQLIIDGETLETEVHGRWDWYARDFAGVYELTVKAPNQRVIRTQIRVQPSKFTQDRYETMLEEISQISSELVFALNSPASEYATLSRGQRSSMLTDFRLIKLFMQQLMRVMGSIRQSPHAMLGTHQEERTIDEVAHFAGDVLPVAGETIFVGFSNRHMSRTPFVPRNWIVERNEPTYDVPENRLIKHFLRHQLLPRIQQICERADLEIARRTIERDRKLRRGWKDDETPRIIQLKKVNDECEAFTRQCFVWEDLPFLCKVGSYTGESRPTQVLQKHPHYSRFYRIYSQFQNRLKYTNNAERYIDKIATRKVAELYEIWSVFKLTATIVNLLRQNGYVLSTSNGFYTLIDDQLQVEVDRNATIELAGHGQRVVIRYEPLYPAARTQVSGMVADWPDQLTPDLAIEIWKADKAIKAIILDAKYRVDGNTYRAEDLEKMDRYKNRICWKLSNPQFRPQRIVTSAYIIYPGSVLEHDSDYPEVGALPLKPKGENETSILSALAEILKNAGLF